MKVKRRVCSAALTLAMTLSLLVTMVLPAGAVDYAGGSGTRNDPYLIATAQQLKNFRDQVNAGDRDLCASLIANVDLAGQDWDPIGLSSSGYVGTFEGNGYAIRNLKISRLSAGTSTGGSTLWGGGLFGIVGKGGLVGQTYQSGATLENGYSAVTIRANTNGRAQIGGLLGHLDASGTYRNLHANGDLCTALLGSGSASRLTGCTLLGTGAMKQASFAAQLGSAFAADTQKVNQGYPILQVMAYDEESGWSEWFEDEAMGDNINQEIFDSLIPAELQNRDLTRDITRAEFCAVSVRLYEQMGGQKLDAAALDSPFADTGSDAVKKAYALGITNGVSPTAFAPYTHISREQLATMLTRVYKALNLPGWTLATDDQYTLDYSGTTPFADDGDISAYAKPSVYFMVKNQVIKGTSPTTFSPRNVTAAQEAIGYANASREQALIMAVRMFQKL